MPNRNLFSMGLTVAALVMLSACSSFTIDAPKDGSTIRAPATTKVVVVGKPSMSGLVVRVTDPNSTNDVSSQINAISSTTSEGSLSLPVTRYSITAEADVPCWYCSNRTYHPSTQRTFCVAAQSWPSNAPSNAGLARADGLSWTKTSDTTVGVAPASGAELARWHLLRTSGIAQSMGIVQSTENSCLCMKSIDDLQETQIGLAICDASDRTQIWEAFPVPNTGGHHRFQNFGRGVSSACLTEGPNSTLVQRSCLDHDNQLWRIVDKNNQVTSPF